MLKLIAPVLASLTIALAAPAFAEETASPAADKKTEEKKADGHCEKSEGGKDVDLDVPAGTADAKKWCKDQGGKWQKGAKHDHKG